MTTSPTPTVASVEATSVKERPILFSGPMVRAILDGQKTQTRRVVKPMPKWADKYPILDPTGMAPGHGAWWWNGKHDRVGVAQECPYGRPGDRLWVKETHRFDIAYDTLKPTEMDSHAAVWYEADGTVIGGSVPGKTRVSLHMQKRFSRFTLEIVNSRVERLNDCSEADALAEGSQHPSLVPIVGVGWSSRDMYARLWEHINGPGSWAANPFVWVVEFKAHAQPIGGEG